jgi:hypothetical protein
MKNLKSILLEDLENLNQEDKSIHGTHLKELIKQARTMKELNKIRLTLDVLLNRDIEIAA